MLICVILDFLLLLLKLLSTSPIICDKIIMCCELKLYQLTILLATKRRQQKKMKGYVHPDFITLFGVDVLQFRYSKVRA